MESIRIKNMVCPRCVEAVTDTFWQLGLKPDTVELGLVAISPALDAHEFEALAAKLDARGFELIRPEETDLPAQIRSGLIRYQQLVEEGGEPGLLSGWLSAHLHKNYSYLSEQFSGAEGQTITQYFEKLRIERAKELLSLGQQSVGEIALLLGYSSSQHFSVRFKQQTGFSPTTWRKESGTRRPLDAL